MNFRNGIPTIVAGTVIAEVFQLLDAAGTVVGEFTNSDQKFLPRVPALVFYHTADNVWFSEIGWSRDPAGDEEGLIIWGPGIANAGGPFINLVSNKVTGETQIVVDGGEASIYVGQNPTLGIDGVKVFPGSTGTTTINRADGNAGLTVNNYVDLRPSSAGHLRVNGQTAYVAGFTQVNGRPGNYVVTVANTAVDGIGGRAITVGDYFMITANVRVDTTALGGVFVGQIGVFLNGVLQGFLADRIIHSGVAVGEQHSTSRTWAYGPPSAGTWTFAVYYFMTAGGFTVVVPDTTYTLQPFFLR
jgi:hypothetical protein